MTDKNTFSTASITVLKDLAVSKSVFYKPPKAASALLTSGTA